MILETDKVTGANIHAILQETLTKLQVHEQFYKTVDFNRKWDGLYDAPTKRDTNYNGTAYTYHIPLTYGAFVVIYIVKDDAVTYLTFGYVLPQAADRWQMLYKNSIERAFYRDGAKKATTTVRAFRKAVKNKIDSLNQGVGDWFDKVVINPKNLNKNTTTQNSGNCYLPYLIGAIGRARLLAQFHTDKAAASNLPSHGARITGLLDEIVGLLKDQQTLAPVFNCTYDETF